MTCANGNGLMPLAVGRQREYPKAATLFTASSQFDWFDMSVTKPLVAVQATIGSSIDDFLMREVLGWMCARMSMRAMYRTCHVNIAMHK